MKQFFLLTALLTQMLLIAQPTLEKGYRLLESGDYAQAKSFFKAYLNQDPQNFSARICYGRALGIGEDPQASHRWFLEMEEEYPANLEVLLNLSESYLWKKDYEGALDKYQQLITDHPGNFNAWLGYANTLSNLKHYPDALGAIQGALDLSPDHPAALTSLKYIRLGQAYAFQLDKEFSRAFGELDSLDLSHPGDPDGQRSRAYLLLASGSTKKLNSYVVPFRDEPWVIPVQAALFMQEGAAIRAIPLYQQVLRTSPGNFEARMGLAHALEASDQKKAAFSEVTAILKDHPDSIPAKALRERLEKSWSPAVSNTFTYSWDSGQNRSWSIATEAALPFGSGTQFRAGYSELVALNPSGNESRLSTGVFKASYRPFRHALLSGSAQLNRLETAAAVTTYPMFAAAFRFRPWKMADISLGWQQQLEDFNADLLQQGLRNSRYALTFHQGSTSGWGIYSNLQEAGYSDGNQARMIFASLYRSLGDTKAFKLGLNLQYLGFEESRPTQYFSPLSYKAGEFFVRYEATWWEQLALNMGLAGGMQETDAQGIRPSARVDLKCVYTLSPRIQLSLSGLHSNLASGNTAGFQFSRVMTGFRWQISGKPLLRI